MAATDHPEASGQQELQANLDATSRLLRIGSLFLREGNLEDVLGEIVEAAIAIAGADFGNIQLLDRDSGDLRIAAYRGFPSWWLEYWDSVHRGHGACGTALERRARVVVEDIERDPIFAGTEALEIQRRAGVRAVQSTPLLSRTGDPIGMMSTHFRQPTVPDEHRLKLIELVARQAADIIERARVEQDLRDADRRKDDFLAVLSHELRNPLASIAMSLDLVDRVPPGSKQAQRYLAVIRRQFGHLSRLIDDLLDVTRITSGKIALRRELVDLTALVRRTIEDQREAFVHAGLVLEVITPPDPIHVDADPTRLAQIVGNLLHNAMKFTPAGGKVTVSLSRDVPLGQALLRVQDTGRGIPDDILPRVFEPFVQADTTLDRAQGGLGLGLAVARGLVELHGGTIVATCEQGTTFAITLPLAPPASLPAPVPVRSELQASRRRVLVIEDNADTADALCSLLELDGYETDVAYDGASGLEHARQFEPDVIVCDVGLPEIDGYQVARTLRADPRLGHTALVALTGYGSTADVARTRDAGFDEHLTKPVGADKLARVLTRLAG